MKDRKGNELKVGDKVFVLDRKGMQGGSGYIRRFSIDRQRNTPTCRVDDGPADMGEDLTKAPDGAWSWSAWCGPEEVEKV